MAERGRERRAVAAWVEAVDDVPILCMDTESGETVAYRLSPTAAGGLKDAIVNGPQVSDTERTEDLGETWVGNHHGSEMQCHVSLEALHELGLEPGDKVTWDIEDGTLVGRPDRSD